MSQANFDRDHSQRNFLNYLMSFMRNESISVVPKTINRDDSIYPQGYLTGKELMQRLLSKDGPDFERARALNLKK